MDALKQINWRPVLAYLALAGGLSALIVGPAVGLNIAPPLAQIVLFGLLGVLAYGFGVRTAVRGWKWLAALWWIGAGTMFMIYLIVAGIVSPGFGIVLLFAGEAAMLMAFAVRRPAAKALNEGAVVEWRKLETGINKPDQPATSDNPLR
jgi:hypothetical protein